jgi:hypothetical protein
MSWRSPAHGVYALWTATGDRQTTHVATIVIAPRDHLGADPTQRTQKQDSA